MGILHKPFSYCLYIKQHLLIVFFYMDVIILFLYFLKSMHNMFYKPTYNGITLQGWNK